MKTASSLLLAAALVGGSAGGRVLQDVPEVGLGPMHSPEPSTSLASESSTSVLNEEELVEALESDDQVTVMSDIQVGELLCDTLVNAEDAAALSFILLEGERVVAEQTSYTVTGGDPFSDEIGRKVWTGVVTEPEQGDDEAFPRTISMTWGDVCDTETFFLKVTKRNIDGTTSIVKTVPCFGSDTDTCLVEVMVEFEDADDPLVPEDDTSPSSSTTTRESSSSSSSGSASTTSSPGPSSRRLQSDTVIDVMVFYSISALTALGGITPQQMETIILESLEGTNQAMINSGVSLHMNPVHVGLLPYEVTTSDSATTLTDFQANANVGLLRDIVGADLVQLVSDFDNSCARGYVFNGNEAFGYSLVRPTCLDNFSHTHLFGHNLGCNRNREDTSVNHEYAHGFRYCDGEDPYRTIMSLSCGSPRVNFFSNPDIIHLNRPTGTLTEDNARAIEDNMVAVSNYRNPVTPPTPAPTTVAPTTAPPTTAPSTTAPPTIAPSTTAPPTPQPSPTFSFIGCYEDNSRDRVLTGRSVKGDRTMTTEVCAEFCAGAPIFGTEFGQECFCGVESDDPARLGNSRCTIPCAGDASQTCGGNNAITVYEFEDTVVTEPEFLGCWTDARDARIMDVVETDPSMTNELCEEICSSFAFYGTQFGQECWCGDEDTDITIHGESNACTRACAGDADTICGGRFAMSVWQYR